MWWGKLSDMFLPDVAPYGLSPREKAKFLERQLGELLAHHRRQCPGYARLADDWSRRAGGDIRIEDYLFLPVSAFKEFELKSTDAEVATVKSSATTSGRSSNIYVDKPTKKRQSLSANKILADFVGGHQRPYLVFDLEETVRGTQSYSARGAAIMGLAHLATEFFFMMRREDGNLKLDKDAFSKAVETVGNGPFLAYGFTFVLYQAHTELAECGLPHKAANTDSILLHSGGWKKLTDMAVDKSTFNRHVAGPWSLDPSRVIDFYGTVEQVGVVYPDCSEGRKHVPYWADVVIRRSDTLEPAGENEIGLIQLISCLPLSAPNHSVLTEDLGRIVLADGCRCGRRGKAFLFEGRAPKSELRGCSDVAKY